MGFTKEENLDCIRRINKILKHADRGFYIFTTKTAATQNDVVGNLNLDGVFIYDWSKNIKPYSYYDLVELIDENPETRIFIILNFQLALQEKNDLYNLNLSRDVLAAHNKLWIFGMTQNMDDRLARTAFDFYAYVMMKIRFKEEKESERV